MNIVIRVDGGIEYVYHDTLQFLEEIGPATTRRVSDVEPSSGWTADMGRVNGPLLGPFKTRTEALEKESQWLQKYYL
jgi:hypothetical protein